MWVHNICIIIDELRQAEAAVNTEETASLALRNGEFAKIREPAVEGRQPDPK
jgi:hypothetical protein